MIEYISITLRVAAKEAMVCGSALCNRSRSLLRESGEQRRECSASTKER
jgi:hypothetical protein